MNDNIKRMRRKAKDYVKIFAKHVSDKGLVSKSLKSQQQENKQSI